MGRYWDGEGANQEAFARLCAELVPESGMCSTFEGEILRAAGSLHYEFFNNGGGNNLSGAFNFLKANFSEFNSAWNDVLKSYVTGYGGPTEPVVLDVCEQILDTVVAYVQSKNGLYSENQRDLLSYAVQTNRFEKYPNGYPVYDDDDDEERYGSSSY